MFSYPRKSAQRYEFSIIFATHNQKLNVLYTMKVENPLKKDMLFGLIWCVLGLSATYISYYFASQEGSSFGVFYGAVLWGIYQFCRGYLPYIRQLQASCDMQAFLRWTFGGLCVLLAMVVLLFGSLGFIHPKESLMANPQTVEYPELGVTLNYPVGFAELEQEVMSETDSTYAYYTIYTYDQTYAYHVEITVRNEPDTTGVEDMFEFFADNAFIETDSVVAYPEIVRVGDKVTVRYIRYAKVDSLMVVCHDMLHRGNLVSLYTYAMGEALDSLQLDCADDFVRYYMELR